MPLVNSQQDTQIQNQRDEISKILKSQSGGASIGDMAQSATERISKAYGRRSDAQTADQVFSGRQATELAGPMAQLKVMEEGAAAGSARTKALLESFGQFADNPEDLAKLIAAAHDDPQPIDETNAATWAAMKSRELGLQSVKKMQANAQLEYAKAKAGGGIPVVTDGTGLPSTVPATTSEMKILPDTGQPLLPPPSGTEPMDKSLMKPDAAAPATPKDNYDRYAEVMMNGQKVKAGQGQVFLVDPTTKMVVGKEKLGVNAGEKPLKKDEKADLKTAADTYDSLDRAFNGFKEDYAQIGGMGVGGSVIRKGQEIFSNDPANVERIGWWKDYNAFENIFRHSLFGSALTAGEQAQWERANFDENSNPATVKKALDVKHQLAQQAIGRTVGQLVAAGKSRAEIAAQTGFNEDELDDIAAWGKHESMKSTAPKNDGPEPFEGFSNLSLAEQKRARELMGNSNGPK